MMQSFWKHPQQIWWRWLLMQVHLWTGIGLGLYIFVVSVSGAALVFREEIIAASYTPVISNVPGERMDWSTLHQHIQNAYPQHKISWFRNRENPREAVEVWLEKDSGTEIVLADAVSGKVLGPKGGTIEATVKWLADLHISLLAGQTGRIVNGIGSGFLCLLCITGLVIWWPGIRNWRRSLTIDLRKSWKRINWDLHSAVGFWTLAFVMIWGVTGIYLIFPQPFRNFVGMIAPLQAAGQRATPPVAPQGGEVRSLSSLVSVAEQATPGKVTTWVGLPYRKGQAVSQIYRQDSFDDHASLTGVVLNAYTGEVQQIRDFENLMPGDRILRWFGYLHFGNFGGTSVKVLWTVIGIAPAILFVTGFLMWWNRFLSKKWKAIRVPGN